MQDLVGWVAVVMGVVAVTLAVVAIWFAVSVDRRARQQQADLTLRSLLRVQAAVEAQVGDTQHLIRAGWDRVLAHPAPTTTPSAPPYQDEQVRLLAAAIAEALRREPSAAEAPASGPPGPPESPKPPMSAAPRVPRQADRSRTPSLPATAGPSTVGSSTPGGSDAGAVQPGAAQPGAVQPGAVQHWAGVLARLDPVAYELARALDAFTDPLHREEYLVLARHRRTAPAVRELRRAGLLAPLPPRGDEGGAPVYGFPPGLAAAVHAAYGDPPRADPKAATLVREVLVEAGYLDRAGDDYVLAHGKAN